MNSTRRTVLIGASSVLIPAVGWSQEAAPKLFADSRIVVTDRMSVEITGRGPDVVLIPGSVSSREVWRPVAEALRSRYRLHLVQLAGFGGEPARANVNGPAWEPTAEAIDAYVAQARIKPVLVGHSLGGTMSLYLAQKHPDHYRKAMLVDATPYLAETMRMPDAAVTGMRGAIAANRVQPMSMAQIEPNLVSMISNPEDREAVRRMALASDPKAAGLLYVENMVVDLRPGLKAMTTPVTIVFPDNVPNGAPAGVVRATYEKAFADLKGVTLIEVKNSRHFVMQDQPEAFGQILERYLAKR